MSSSLAAVVCAALMNAQARGGMRGNVAEIGTFEGRFLTLLALGLRPDERAIGIDTFDWPDAGVQQRLEERLTRFGVRQRTDIIKGSSRIVTKDMLVASQSGQGVRFFHIDGDHTAESIVADLRLAIACAEPWCVICLDDMLSPAYPELMLAVLIELRTHPDWAVFCVVDREDIVAATKFLVCRRDYLDVYVNILSSAFPALKWPLGSQFQDHKALVLSPAPRFLRFLPGGRVKGN